jgi:hypothetical protein
MGGCLRGAFFAAVIPTFAQLSRNGRTVYGIRSADGKSRVSRNARRFKWGVRLA